MTRLRKASLTLAGLLVIGLAVAAVWLRPQAQIGVGYAAKQVCSCVYLGGATSDRCLLDLGPDISERIDIVALPETQGIKAEVFPLAVATAYFHRDSGCTLQ